MVLSPPQPPRPWQPSSGWQPTTWEADVPPPGRVSPSATTSGTTTWKPRQIGRPPAPSWDEGGNRWLVKLALGAIALAILLPMLVVLILYTDYKGLLSGSLPPEKPGIESGLTRIYDANGTQIGLLRQFDLSIPVAESDIPTVLKQAVVAAEDRRFYEHSGVDDRAVFRAIWADLTGGGYVEGASTLTQQYVRLVYLNDEKSLKRKIKEAALARKVEKEMTKDQILYSYLDRVYLGDGAYGVGAAAQSYFRKPVKDLTLSEAALLAGLIRLPSVNAPRTNPAGAEDAREQVLGQMLAQRRISQADYDDAMTQKVFLEDDAYKPEGPATVVYPQPAQESAYPYFTDYVRRYLIAKYGDEKTYTGGLKVYTSLDPTLQAKAEAAVKNTLQGTAPPLEMSLVSVDPRTGLVRALIGGRDFGKSEVNLALGHCDNAAPPKDGDPVCIDGGGSGRQPGSSFKPFTLAKALEEGMSVDKTYYGPGTYRFPYCTGGDDNGCVVHNVESGSYGTLTLRAATAYSVNTVYAQLIQDVGVKETAEMAHRLGLTMVNPDGKLPDGTPYGPSLTLGAAETSPLDMAAAYSVFANRGIQQPASPVMRVEDGKGNVLEDNTKRKGRRVLAENIADQVNSVLGDVVQYGTGYGADFGHPEGIAGKTGTSEDYGDAWFVGYTPELSTAIWMGYSDSRSPLTNVKGQARVFGATFGVPTWKAYMTDAAPLLGLTDFAKPAPPTTLPPVYTPPPSYDVPSTSTPSPALRPPVTLGPRPTTTLPRQTVPTVSPTSIYRPPPTIRTNTTISAFGPSPPP